MQVYSITNSLSSEITRRKLKSLDRIMSDCIKNIYFFNFFQLSFYLQYASEEDSKLATVSHLPHRNVELISSVYIFCHFGPDGEAKF